MILICANRAAYDLLRDDIVCTPSIDGSSPVALQDEPAVAADGVRCCIEHNFTDAEGDWLRAYTANDNPAVLIVDVLPADWYITPEVRP